jgi:hypothetical protein
VTAQGAARCVFSLLQMIQRWSILRTPCRRIIVIMRAASHWRDRTPRHGHLGRLPDCSTRRANIDDGLIRFIWRFCVSAMPAPIAGMSFRWGYQKCGSGTHAAGSSSNK